MNLILANNLPISQLEIDDDWTSHYGDWVFHKTKFPNPKDLIERLKLKIPAVSVWMHPFISTDAAAFPITAAQDMLIKAAADVAPGLLKWWNPGYAALLDFSKNQTAQWFLNATNNLRGMYSVDSFKFDAGEIYSSN